MSKAKQKEASFNLAASDVALVQKIVERFAAMRERNEMPLNPIHRLNLTMDIEACHANGSPLNLSRLLASCEGDFVHDIAQISVHIDRTTGEMPGWFHPKCNR